MEILDEEMDIIINIIKNHTIKCEVLIFGSRLKGNNHPFSDLDLAFICKKGLEFKKKISLQIAFDDSDLPYRVDIVDYNNASKEFKEIIDRDNKKIWGDGDEF